MVRLTFVVGLIWTVAALAGVSAAAPVDLDYSGFVDGRDLWLFSERWTLSETPYQETSYGRGDLLNILNAWHSPVLTPVEHLPSLVEVPAGKFLMGNSLRREDRNNAIYAWCFDREFPQHWVQLNTYFIGQYEVTIEEYAEFLNDGNDDHWTEEMADTKFCGLTRSGLPGSYQYSVVPGRERIPIVYATWYDAVAYCAWLREMVGQPYRLPTEAEWEKAARWDPIAETPYIYPWGDLFSAANLNCWTGTPGEHSPKPIGSYPSGAHQWPEGKVYDVAGNVWEYVSDYFAADYYSQGPGGATPGAQHVWFNPQGPVTGATRVIRGGSWAYMAYQLAPNDPRCALRHLTYPNYHHTNVGFRVARD